MIADLNPTRVSWIDPAARHPICDVPWVGTSIVQADGTVNFCCYSSTVVGNVSESSFAEIWQGEAMRQIRTELAKGRFPEACRSTSCPLYRGDELHHIRDRMEGCYSLRRTGTHDPHRQVRELLRGSALHVSRTNIRQGDALEVSLAIEFAGMPKGADLFVSLRAPDGAFRFLPSLEDYPVPFETTLALGQTSSRTERHIWSGPLPPTAVGPYEFCAALFELEADPNLLSNCFWSDSVTVDVRPALPLQKLWRRLTTRVG